MEPFAAHLRPPKAEELFYRAMTIASAVRVGPVMSSTYPPRPCKRAPAWPWLSAAAFRGGGPRASASVGGGVWARRRW
jgi:hypothetical protein